MSPRGALLRIASLLLVFAAGSGLAEAPPIAEHSAKSEVARVQRHLRGAEALLASAKTHGMSETQRAARRIHMERLAAYRAAGRFPHNHEVPGRRAPCFVDKHGTQCAMAYLIARSGRTDIVDLVARTRNYATVVELAADEVVGPALLAWLEDAGLSVEEAQRVQPTYPYQFPHPERRITGQFASASGSLGLVNLVTLGMNAGSAVRHRGPRWPAILGLASGAASIGLGAANTNYEGERRTLGFVDIALGSASIAASAWSMIASRPAPSLDFRLPGSDVLLRPSVGMNLRLGGPGAAIRGTF